MRIKYIHAYIYSYIHQKSTSSPTISGRDRAGPSKSWRRMNTWKGRPPGCSGLRCNMAKFLVDDNGPMGDENLFKILGTFLKSQ